MSQQDGFANGFFLGAFVGSLIGGVLGAVITYRRDTQLAGTQETEATDNPKLKRQMKASETQSIEVETARRSLEDKIAQLNATIDDVRRQLGNVNGNSPQAISERSLSQDS
jgi:predicted RNase H-like nuclease (RuvC/YqgF family)